MGNAHALQGAPLRAVGPARLYAAMRASDGIVRGAEPVRVAGQPTQVTDNLIEIEGLRFSRGDRIIFDGLDLVVPRGSITALMGPSGTGKTTLLRIIGGQIRPDSGRVIVDGLDVPKLSRGELFELAQKHGHAVPVVGVVYRYCRYSKTSPFRCASTPTFPMK